MRMFSDKLTINLPIYQIKSLLGEYNQHLLMIGEKLKVKIDHRGDSFQIKSKYQSRLTHSLNILYDLIEINKKTPLDAQFLAQYLQENNCDSQKYKSTQIKIGRKTISAKSANQAHFIENMNRFSINFATGPAGSGKSWLSVAFALSAFDLGLVQKIVLCRPVLEAGEKLGFLPGDLTQKIDPFLKPLQDALYEMYPANKIDQLLASKQIEVLPLAYMRGRTLNESIVILDEAQNTSHTQMKMFLTRMGYNSKLIINGDLTQNDLPKHSLSGLSDAKKRLEKLGSIGFCSFAISDIVRHPLVQQIVACYDDK